MLLLHSVSFLPVIESNSHAPQLLRRDPIAGFDADYAYMIRALIDLFEASHDDAWLEWAEQLQVG